MICLFKQDELHEAEYYEKLDNKKVRCRLCPRNCVINDGELGDCKARKNIDGILYALGYSRFTSVHDDPIEKKPLYHFMPGTYTLSFGGAGCNLHCIFCQNWTISQISAENVNMVTVSPIQALELTRRYGCDSIAFTYNEPLINFEWVRDTSKLAQENRIATILVTNGLINHEPLEELVSFINAANVDIKAFNNDFYRNLAQFPGFGIIKRNVITMWKAGVHVELTMLLIPGYNDNFDEIRQFARWVIEELDDTVPVHFSRFYPNYKMQNTPPTPVETVIDAKKVAEEEGLRYVFTGNLPYSEVNDTYCQKCGATLVRRVYYNVKKIALNKQGQCSKCLTKSDISVDPFEPLKQNNKDSSTKQHA